MKNLAGKNKCHMMPAHIKQKPYIVQISCFSNYTMELDNKGNVYGCGSNLKGRMGIEDKVDDEIEFPVQIKCLVNIQKIDCGYWHSLALDQNG